MQPLLLILEFVFAFNLVLISCCKSQSFQLRFIPNGSCLSPQAGSNRLATLGGSGAGAIRGSNNTSVVAWFDVAVVVACVASSGHESESERSLSLCAGTAHDQRPAVEGSLEQELNPENRSSLGVGTCSGTHCQEW